VFHVELKLTVLLHQITILNLISFDQLADIWFSFLLMRLDGLAHTDPTFFDCCVEELIVTQNIRYRHPVDKTRPFPRQKALPKGFLLLVSKNLVFLHLVHNDDQLGRAKEAESEQETDADND
jgi:hypothetical protein